MASIGGARGVLVVGGATGDDLVEFLDWDARDQWRKLGRLNRGRGMASIQGMAKLPFIVRFREFCSYSCFSLQQFCNLGIPIISRGP